MSMFRSPNDDSSSDSKSSNGEQNIHSYSFERSQAPPVSDSDVGGLPEVPLQLEETVTESVPGNDDSWDTTDWLPNTAEQHATLLTSSLLEFTYNVKAAEHLNRVQGTTRFNRDSPEARTLGAIMFQGASKVLASTGIIADCVHEEEWREMRQQYLIGVDNLGLQAFNESMSQQPNSPRGRLSLQDTNMVAFRTSQHQQEFLNLHSSKYLPARLANISQHREVMAAMLRSLAVPSPHADLQLSPSSSAATGNRYKAEFWELKRLGKGGFGTVYHVKNFVDNQDYAVKKIPLDPRCMRNWKTNGEQEVEALLKEIRTLARLEHSNIVRYYAAWIEGAEGWMSTINAGKIPHQLYLKDRPTSSNDPSLPSKAHRQLPSQASDDEDSLDVAFKENHLQHSADLENGRRDDSMGIVFGEDSDALSKKPDFSQPGRRMPTQRTKLSQVIHDQSSSILSVSNETDIFTDGDGEARSGESKRQKSSAQPMMVLHIQMSLHPLSLSTYLAASGNEPSSTHLCHCFHLGPSLRLVRAIVSGVEYLHSQGIIHRDIKPGNIFLSEHYEYDRRPGCVDTTCSDCKPARIKRYLNPRIGDFGLVADISGLNAETTNVEASSFISKAVGTEFYRPPQRPRQTSGDAIDGKLDVYALGILLFELLWKMDTKMERHMLLSNLSKEAMLPADFAGKIDPRGRCWRSENIARNGKEISTIGECVEDCIRNMVSASPSRRWGCGQVRERLDDVINMLE
jgi:eukaryotic translation initiation factor 2-alpha kinase 3